MNEGQFKFYHFILERVDKEQQQEAHTLLMESFRKQDEGDFTKAYLQTFIPGMLAIVKEEAKEEIKEIMEQFQK